MQSEVSLEAAARELLEANTQTAVKDGRTYTFSVPSPQAYPFQWFWDSCFHAITWARFDAERAAEELRGLFAWQGRDGFMPHVIFWNQELARRNPSYWHFRESRPWLRRPKTTARLQPPVIAQAVERVVDAGGGDAFVRETIEPLERYYRYLAAARDPDGDSLLTIISSFESGLDHCPVYDHPFSLHVDDADPLQPDAWWALRREFVNKLFGHRASILSRIRRSTHEDVHFTSIYAQGLRALARLADRGGDDALARWARDTASRVTEALMERSYDARTGLFRNLVGSRQEPVRVKTIVSLMPLILEDLPRAAVESLVQHLANPDVLARLPGRLDREGRAGVHTRPDTADLARADVDEHELVPGARPAGARLSGSRRHDRGALTRRGRAPRLQRVLQPAHRGARRRRDVRLGNAGPRPLGRVRP